ncbi:alkylhydroperoxidase, partial [Paenibacillus macerans]
MAIINLSHRGDTSFDKLLGHLPSVQEKWNALEDILKNEGQLSVDLKEEI